VEPRTRVGWLVSMVVGPLLGLTACGGHDSTADSPASGDPTALPSRTPPSTEKAESFVRHWAVALAQMENTGKPARFLAMSSKCPVCRALAQNIVGRYAAGGYIHWDGLRIDSIKRPPATGGTMLFTVHAHSAPITVRESSSRPVRHFPGQRVTYLVGVMPLSGSFGVTSMTSE
jgi:hypothetical protein